MIELLIAAAQALVAADDGENQHRCDVRCDEWTGDVGWQPCVGQKFRDALGEVPA